MARHESIEAIEAMLEAADGDAVELAGALLGLYGEALARIVDAVGEEVADRLAADDLVGNLLLLHDLHPVGTRERVEAALRGSGAELLSLEGGVARVRVAGGGCGCSAASVERAVYDAAPEVERVEIARPAPVIPVESLLGART
uniref:hypothetical protein n=1 Tax=Nonomuraea pusilla TaxID=46177 RepID=UPI0006E3883F|nr:hypothetical protein [Nonomuraea pusilla]